MVFIFVGKAFHTHKHNSLSGNFTSLTIVKSDCTICDYHFVKDADNFPTFVKTVLPVSFVSYTIVDVSNHVFITPCTTALRGPPVAAWI